MREVFFIDHNGEACSKTIYRNKAEQTRIEKEEHKESKQRSKDFWSKLSEAQREIIKWCRTDAKAQKECLPMAQVRERCLDAFYRIKTGQNLVPSKVEKYELVYLHFYEFKNYVQKL